MLGIVPAAGVGSRIQPLAFSKELLPVGSRIDQGMERPKAVSEYLVERMISGGVDRICFVIAPGKSDIVGYFGPAFQGVPICYVVQPEPLGLVDSMFRALPFVQRGEHVIVGLPDTVWFPEDALRHLGSEELSFLLFPVESPALFDAVVFDARDHVLRIEVKQKGASSRWVWGAFKVSDSCLKRLHGLWTNRAPRDEFFGTLVNALLQMGGEARAYRLGEAYVDVGTLHGYRNALRILSGQAETSEVPNAGR